MATDEKASPDTESEAAENKAALDEAADETISKEIENLKVELEKAQATAEENWQATLRATAELENTRKRLERDVENAHKFAMERFVQELLPVIDSLEMGLAAASEEGADLTKVCEGTELTLKKFQDTASKFGIETVNPVGEDFNPEYHQAMSMLESNDHKPNSVIDVMQKGYVLQGRLIRPAMVVVAKASASNKSKQDEEEKIGTKIDEKA
jgi:molecular chaperone GrpE